MINTFYLFWFKHNSNFQFTAQSDYNTRRAGITSAIVIAILIPVGICLFCVLIHLRQRAQEKAFNKGYGDNRNSAPFQPRDSAPTGGGRNDYEYMETEVKKSSSHSSLNKNKE